MKVTKVMQRVYRRNQESEDRTPKNLPFILPFKFTIVYKNPNPWGVSQHLNNWNVKERYLPNPLGKTISIFQEEGLKFNEKNQEVKKCIKKLLPLLPSFS